MPKPREGYKRECYKCGNPATSQSYCKVCQAAYTKAYYQNNREKRKEQNKVLRMKNSILRRALHAESKARKRAKEFCECCSQEKLVTFYMGRVDGVDVDHIIPLIDGGKHCVLNLQYMLHGEHTIKTWEDRRLLEAYSKNKLSTEE